MSTMNTAANDYNSKGLELVRAGRHEVAIKFFTMAIEEDSDFLEAYKNRGEALIKLNKIDEGEKDIQKAEGPKKKPDKTNEKQKKVVEKYNLQEVEDLWGSLESEDSYDDDDDDLYGLGDSHHDDDYYDDAVEDEQFEDDLLSDDTSPDDVSEGEQAFDTGGDQFEHDDIPQEEIFSDDGTGDEQIAEETAPDFPETEDFSAILEYRGGLLQEVAHARLFEPMENSILILDEETKDEQVVFFDQLTCLRVSSLPTGISKKQKESCTREIIETVDGKIYQELVHPEQDLDDLLICFPTDDQTPFAFTLFPKSNIKKRSLDQPLVDILLEKRFISKFMLQKALQEYAQLKKMTLEKIVAQKAHVRLAEVEEALNQAKQNQMQGLQKEEILLLSGLADEEQILDAVEYLENIQKLKIGQFLVEKRFVKESEVYISLAEKHKIPFLNLKGRKFHKKTFASLPKSMILNNEILPLAIKDDILLVSTYFVDTQHLSEEIVKIAACKVVKFVLSPPSQIRRIINLLFAQ